MAFDDSKITQTFSDLKMEHPLTRFYMGLAVSSIIVLAIIDYNCIKVWAQNT